MDEKQLKAAIDKIRAYAGESLGRRGSDLLDAATPGHKAAEGKSLPEMLALAAHVVVGRSGMPAKVVAVIEKAFRDTQNEERLTDETQNHRVDPGEGAGGDIQGLEEGPSERDHAGGGDSEDHGSHGDPSAGDTPDAGGGERPDSGRSLIRIGKGFYDWFAADNEAPEIVKASQRFYWIDGDSPRLSAFAWACEQRAEDVDYHPDRQMVWSARRTLEALARASSEK